MKKIERRPLNDLAYEEIRRGLADGLFKPMQPLVIRTLAANYGISASPIREALQRLVAERLLVILPNRSIVVPVMTKSRFRELSPIRGSLEGVATELSTQWLGAAEFRKLHTLLERMNETTSNYDARTYLKLNREFHFTIYEKSANPELLRLIQDLWLKVGPVFNGLFDDDYFRDHANDEHTNILAALEHGDAVAARNFMVQDLSIAAAALLPRLPDTMA